MSIYKALSSAKGEFKPIRKESENPYFKSKYADLETIKGSVDQALAKHGLVVVSRIADGNLHTSLVHIESGDAIDSVFPLSPGLDAQRKGSEISYGRRYSIQCLLDLVALDDDGNEASALSQPTKQAPPAKKEAPFDPIEKHKKALAWCQNVTELTKLGEGFMLFQTHKDNFEKAEKLDLYNQVIEAISKRQALLEKGEEF
jgi:hypothetical protein